MDGLDRDRNYWRTVEDVAGAGNYSYEDMFRHFPVYALRRDLTRFLSHYELFRKVENLPGCIVDLGVWRGTSFFTWSKLLDAFCPYDRSRKVFGFDSFAGLQQFTSQDGPDDPQVQKQGGGYFAPELELQRMLAVNNSDSMIPNTERAKLYVGDIADTIPVFLEENPGVRISLLHLDMDLYVPTRAALEALFPLVLRGGVVVFDEYGLIPWQGETLAADEYFESIGFQPEFTKHSWAQTPHGFFTKE